MTDCKCSGFVQILFEDRLTDAITNWMEYADGVFRYDKRSNHRQTFPFGKAPFL